MVQSSVPWDGGMERTLGQCHVGVDSGQSSVPWYSPLSHGTVLCPIPWDGGMGKTLGQCPFGSGMSMVQSSIPWDDGMGRTLGQCPVGVDSGMCMVQYLLS
jgi:hypothetical protein